MNDETQTYDDNTAGTTLRLASLSPSTILHTVVQEETHRTSPVLIPTARLLAMIDAADPDAMRAYLRETAPDFVADTLRPADGRAADHFDYLDPEVPEADSPEDVDERPGRDDPTERAQLDRSWALELVHRLYPSAASAVAIKMAAWIIDGRER